MIGLIPNCAASVILTQLYLSGAISFSSVIAGLCTGAGIGLVVLFKVNPDKKENIKIIAVLYVIALAIAGLILEADRSAEKAVCGMELHFGKNVL